MRRIIIATGVTLAIFSFASYKLLSEESGIEKRPCNKVEILSDKKLTCEWRRNPVETHTCEELYVYEGAGLDDEWICDKDNEVIHFGIDTRFSYELEEPKLQKADRDYYKGIRDRDFSKGER